MSRIVSLDQANDDGLVAQWTNPRNGENVVLYDAGTEPGFDLKDGRWLVYCSEHGETTQETNQRRARKLMRTPEDWCAACGRVEEAVEVSMETLPVKPVPFAMKSPTDQAREIRYAAMLVGANPEKIALFERIYGVAPSTAHAAEDDLPGTR